MFKEILKGSLVIFGFKIVGTLSNLISNILISRLYGVEAYGVFSLILSFILFFSMFNRLGTDLFIIRKIPELAPSAPDLIPPFIRKTLAIVLIAGLIIGLGILLSQNLIDQFFFKDRDALGYLWGLAFAIVAYTLVIVLSSVLRGFGELLGFSFFQHLYLPLGLLSLLTLSYYGFDSRVDVVYLLYGLLLAGMLLSIAWVGRFLHRRLDQGLFAKRTAGYPDAILKYSYPMVITSSAIFAMAYLGQFFISFFLSLEDVALYAAIMKLATPLAFFSTAISSYIAPRITRNYLSGDMETVRRLYKTTIKILITAGVPMLAAFFLFSDFLLGLFGNVYRDQSTAFMIYSLSIFFGAALFGPIGYFMVMTDNQYMFQRIISIALCAYIALSIVLIPQWGIEGAAVSTLAATLIWKFSGYVYLKKLGIL